MPLKLVCFIFISIFLHSFTEQFFHIPFWGRIETGSLLVAYFYMAGANLLFGFLDGIVLALLFRNFEIWKSALICAISLVVSQLAYTLIFASSFSLGFRGYLTVTAPYVGTFVGVLIGVAFVVALRNLWQFDKQVRRCE